MNKSKTLNVRLTEEEKAILEAVCHNEGTTPSILVRQMIRGMAGPRSDNSEWI